MREIAPKSLIRYMKTQRSPNGRQDDCSRRTFFQATPSSSGWLEFWAPALRDGPQECPNVSQSRRPKGA